MGSKPKSTTHDGKKIETNQKPVKKKTAALPHDRVNIVGPFTIKILDDEGSNDDNHGAESVTQEV